MGCDRKYGGEEYESGLAITYFAMRGGNRGWVEQWGQQLAKLLHLLLTQLGGNRTLLQNYFPATIPMPIAKAPTNTTIETPAYIMALINAIDIMVVLLPENFLSVLTSGHELNNAYSTHNEAQTMPFYFHSTAQA